MTLTPDDFLSMVSFAQTKPSCRLLAKSSMREAQLSHERIMKLHELTTTYSNSSTKVPVFVMLPLDTMTMGGNLNKPRAMNVTLIALKSSGAQGVMVDAWWGLAEKDGPLKYNWEGYAELIKMCQEHGLKLQAVMSFHQCGGNVGDSCSTPLPPWIPEKIRTNPDLVYTDRSAGRNQRTTIQVYVNYMRSFRERFKDYLGNVILEIQVGIGPCGELRYPAYPEKQWYMEASGIGEFQCYDKGQGGPRDSGPGWQYNQFPEDTGFFKGMEHGTYNTRHRDRYLPIARILAKHHAVLNVTCIEMKDSEQPHSSNCSPEGLVRQVKIAATIAEVELAGENALERYDAEAFSQVLAKSMSDSGNALSAFTFLRINKRLFEPENWRNLVQFVKNMPEGGRNARLPECDPRRTDLYVRFIKKSHSKTATDVAVV
ncbi:unnamed protein product [Withania somnifera]